MAEKIKNPLTELGHVAKDYISRHIMTYVELAEAVTRATGVDIKNTSFTEARRSERGFRELRKTVLNYMYEQDSELVMDSLEAYERLYKQSPAVQCQDPDEGKFE